MAKHRAELSASPSVVPLPRKPRSELLTVDQAAKRLNVPVGYVRRRLIFERRIPYVKIGRHVRIESEVVEAPIEAGRVEVAEVARAWGGGVGRSRRSGRRSLEDGAHPQTSDTGRPLQLVIRAPYTH